MRYFALIAATLLMTVSAASAAPAAPDAGRQITVTAQEEKNAETVPVTEEAVPDELKGEPGLLTVKGIVKAVNPDARTITMSTASGDKTLSYDDGTRFQSGLKSREMSDVQVGSRIAVLYDEKDGKSGLKRVMLVPDKSYGPTKPGAYRGGGHHKKSHGKKTRSSKSHGKKSKAKKTKTAKKTKKKSRKH